MWEICQNEVSAEYCRGGRKNRGPKEEESKLSLMQNWASMADNANDTVSRRHLLAMNIAPDGNNFQIVGNNDTKSNSPRDVSAESTSQSTFLWLQRKGQQLHPAWTYSDNRFGDMPKLVIGLPVVTVLVCTALCLLGFTWEALMGRRMDVSKSSTPVGTPPASPVLPSTVLQQTAPPQRASQTCSTSLVPLPGPIFHPAPTSKLQVQVAAPLTVVPPPAQVVLQAPTPRVNLGSITPVRSLSRSLTPVRSTSPVRSIQTVRNTSPVRRSAPARITSPGRSVLPVRSMPPVRSVSPARHTSPSMPPPVTSIFSSRSLTPKSSPSTWVANAEVVVPLPPEGGAPKLGLAMHETLTIMEIVDPKAHAYGWRPRDKVVKVNDTPVSDFGTFTVQLQVASAQRRLNSSGRPVVIFGVFRS